MVKPQSKIFFVFFFALVLTLSLFLVSASHKSASYKYMIATGFLEEHGPDIAMARNGDTIELMGEGTFTTNPKTITGEGTFVHKNAEGEVIGTGKWAATKLISFQSYGDGTPQGLPAEFEGGRALVKVILDPDGIGPSFEGTLKITCLLGDKIPKKAEEGIQLAVRGIPIHFNKEVGGETVFIRES